MRRFQTLKIKLILPVLFILIIVFLGSSFLIIDREYNAAKESFINNAESFAILSVESLIENYEGYYESGYFIFIEYVDSLLSLDKDAKFIQILDVNGKILFDTSEIEEGKYSLQNKEDRYLPSEELIKRAGLSIATTEIDENKRIIVGVNDYKMDEPIEIPILEMDEKGEERQINRLKKLRKDRNNTKVEKNLNALRKAAEGDENLMPFILDCVHSYATLGETCQVLRDVFGEYIEPAIY